MTTRCLFDRIRQMARAGYGYEDIAVKLELPWREVRPLVIRDGEHVTLSDLREQAAGGEREASQL